MGAGLLSRVNDPLDIRAMDISQLKILAQELREEIIATVARNGGHLASSLGVVELTIALHYVFDTPRDLLVWDVGHQTYAHKLLTGRREVFHTLRRSGGISGFPKREESPYDTFDVGHSSTSISAALGMAEALSRQGKKQKVVAVIGDGSLTAGMAFEALNHLGTLDRDLIVVLNDNEMSISPNVGALSSYLNKILTGQLFTRFRDDMKGFIRTLPGVGEPVSRIVKKWEEYAKGMITPGLLFEELGLKYVGPLDGHRLRLLIETLRNVRQLTGPILVHVVTKKGKGYAPAEQEPTRFHGIGPFDPETGKALPANAKPTYTSVFGRTLLRLAAEDRRIVAITAAMPQGTGLEAFAKEYPDRFYDVGIAEQHAVTMAAGFAAQGMRPVVAIYSTFLQRAYDQVVHDVCLQGLPVVFALDRGGIVGEDGPTHHGLFDLSYLRHIPNMVVMAPKDEAELQQMLATALTLQGPCAVRYPRGEGVGVRLWDGEIPLLENGRCEVLTDGEDLMILAVGACVYPALEASKLLEERGVHATVVNARFVKPLDRDRLLPLMLRIGRVITVEENVLAGGFGSAVLEMLQDSTREVPEVKVLRIGIGDQFVEHGSPAELRARYGLDAQSIAQRALESLEQPLMVTLQRSGMAR
ncbi:MAG: 1-deoxy-D-xylulose-5-phosphate synthase [Thermodesulfobacteriota bacterium]